MGKKRPPILKPERKANAPRNLFDGLRIVCVWWNRKNFCFFSSARASKNNTRWNMKAGMCSSLTYRNPTRSFSSSSSSTSPSSPSNFFLKTFVYIFSWRRACSECHTEHDVEWLQRNKTHQNSFFIITAGLSDASARKHRQSSLRVFSTPSSQTHDWWNFVGFSLCCCSISIYIPPSSSSPLFSFDLF